MFLDLLQPQWNALEMDAQTNRMFIAQNGWHP